MLHKEKPLREIEKKCTGRKIIKKISGNEGRREVILVFLGHSLIIIK